METVVVMTERCGEDECLGRAFRSGLCRTHYEQKRLGRQLKAVVSYASKYERFVEAVLSYAECPDHDEAEFKRRTERLRQAALAWAKSLEPANEPMK